MRRDGGPVCASKTFKVASPASDASAWFCSSSARRKSARQVKFEVAQRRRFVMRQQARASSEDSAILMGAIAIALLGFIHAAFQLAAACGHYIFISHSDKTG